MKVDKTNAVSYAYTAESIVHMLADHFKYTDRADLAEKSASLEAELDKLAKEIQEIEE